MPVQFSDESLKRYHEIIARYPQRQAALLPTLWLAQGEFGWLSEDVIAYVADLMELPVSRVAGVVSFYTMYYRRPVGKYHIQVCRNLSCTLRGSSTITSCIEKRLGIRVGQTTPDKKFTLSEVECLASCGTGPMMQVNEDYVENLTPEQTLELIERLARE